MKRAIVLALGLCLLSAMPALAAISTDWSIDLSKVTGQGLSGVLTIVDSRELTYTGLGHVRSQYVPSQNAFLQNTDILLEATGVRDGATNTVSTASEILNGPSVPGLKTFEITFVAHVQTVANNLGQFAHLPGGTLDVYVENTSNGFLSPGGDGRANPNVTAGGGSGGGGFMGGTLVARFVDVGIPGGGQYDLAHLNGDDNGVFKCVWALPGVFLDSKGADLLNQVSPLYTLALTDSDVHLDADHDGLLDSGPPANWPAGWDRTVSAQGFDFFFTEDGSASFVIPEPVTAVVWGLLGLCAIGLVRFCRKK